MLKKPLFLSFRFLLPFAAVLILLGAFFFYYFLIISRQESSVNLRAFRALASTSGQLRDLVSNYGEVLHVADQNRDSKGAIIHEVRDFLSAQVPNLKLDVPSSPSKVIFQDDGSYLQLSHGRLRANFRLSIALEPLLNEAPNELFDDVFLTDANGAVLYQTQRSGVVATDLSSILTALPADSRKSKSGSDSEKKDNTSTKKESASRETAEPAKTEAEGARSRAYAAMTESSNLAQVTMAGTDYRAYLVPILLTLEEGNSDAARGQDETRENMRLVLCGLMRQTEFRGETRSVPGVALTTLILTMILVIVAAWPVLKFATMRKTEHIPKYAAILYAASTTATLILMMVLVIHTRYVFSNPETDQNLKDLAKKLDSNFGTEVKKALLVMDAVMKSPEFSSKVHEDSPRPCTTVQPFTTPNPMSDLLTNNKLRLAEYPYFLRIFAYDSNGSEQVKWTIDQTLPPGLRVCGKSYFEGVMKNELWQLSSEGPSGFRFRVDPIYSRLTSEYLAVITQPVPRELAGEHSVLRVSLMTIPMLSLIRPVLPADYGFAVVDASGKVLFHSDTARNGRENFFDETKGQELRTAVTAAHARTLDVSYLGDQHRMFVTPMTSVQHSGWYLITFSNLEILAAQRVETMVLFSALAAIYFIWVIVCTAAVLLLLSLWKHPLVFWPDKKNIGCYIHIFFTIVAITALCCWVIFDSDPSESLIYGLVIPFASMFLVLLKLSGRSRPIMWASISTIACVLVYFFVRLAVLGPWEAFSPLVLICGAFFLLAQDAISTRIGSWARRRFRERDNLLLAVAFSMAHFCVLVLMSVPSCIAAFKAAHDYEETVATQREQLLVMSALEKRENRVVRRYCQVKFSEVEQETCSADLARWLFIRRRLEEQDLDVYGSVFSDQRRGQLFEPESPVRIPLVNDGKPGSAPPEQPDFLVKLAATLMPRADSVTRELSQKSSNSRWEWTPEGVHRIRIQRSSAPATESSSRQALARLYANDSGFLTQSLAYDLAMLKAGEFMQATGIFIVAILGLMLVSVWSTLRRMFLLSKKFADLGEPYPEISLEAALQESSGGDAPPSDRSNLILLTFPCSGKTDKLTKLTHAGKAVYVDLTSGRLIARQKLNAGGPGSIVLDHFETAMSEGVISKWVLELLEDLLSQGKKIIIVSTVDPHYRPGTVADDMDPALETSSRDLERAERVLGHFKTMRVEGEIIRHTDSCYHFLWTSCAWDEKVALYGIAKDGWANHKNFSALLRLYKRGLIKRDPNFILTFAHFRHYLLRTISRREQRSLELKDTTGLWDGLRIMFYVLLIGMVAAVLFFNQHEILGYITTGVSAILPAARLLSQIGGGKSSSAKGDSAGA